MLRLFVALTLLFINLYACKGGYSSCQAKVKDSHTIQNKTLFIPVSKTTRLVYSRKKIHAKILKYDPFLSLYLIADKNSFAYPFDLNMRLQLGTAMINDTKMCEGRFLKNQVGLNQLALYSEPLITPAIVSSSCCSLEGVVTPRGIIQKEYIKNFLDSKEIVYGDIGIRVKNENGRVLVSASDPFFKNNPFLKGDRVVAFDGRKIEAASLLMRKILFSRVGTNHTLKIKRADKFITLKVTTKKRYGGGSISDTFLESQGLYFSKNLVVTKVEKIFKKYGVKKGDRLININGVGVKNQKELRHYLQKYKNYSKLLIERDHFQFFVNIK